jgi:aryl-alcohol dehydrogenase-like predicted oxidoreductase
MWRERSRRARREHRGGRSLSLGLGLAALGRPGYVNLGHADDLGRQYDEQLMERRCHDVLDAAWAGGVRHLDVARSYGRAEAFLASWLASRGHPRSALTVASKWGYTYTAGWSVTAEKHEVKDHSLATLTRQLGESRALLGDHLDIYQVHSATLESGVLDDDGVLDALAAHRVDEALTIGITTSGPDQPVVVRRALEIERDGRRLFDAVQTTWNLLERSAGPALAEAHAEGMLVIVKEALANGRLTARNDDPAFASARARLDAVAAQHGTDVSTIALAAALSRPWVDVVLSGAATVGHLRANLSAATVAGTVGGTITADGVLAESTEAPETYWSVRRALRWN